MILFILSQGFHFVILNPDFPKTTKCFLAQFNLNISSWELMAFFFALYVQGNDASEKTESLSKEELGRLVASRWTGEDTTKESGEVDVTKDTDHEDHEELPKETHDEQSDGYASETDDDNQKYDDEEVEEEPDDDFGVEDHSDSGSSYKYESDTDSDLSGTQLPVCSGLFLQFATQAA